jgi:GNAT superfamily N-acetyltransferase
MSIRSALPDDEAGIGGLLRQLHPDQPAVFRPDQVRQGARSFVAAEGEEIVGFALATFVDYGLSSYGMIEELVVDAGRRGRGVGTALVEACREWLAEEQVEVIFVSALDGAAVAFYRRSGFVPCSGPWFYCVPPAPPV